MADRNCFKQASLKFWFALLCERSGCANKLNKIGKLLSFSHLW